MPLVTIMKFYLQNKTDPKKGKWYLHLSNFYYPISFTKYKKYCIKTHHKNRKKCKIPQKIQTTKNAQFLIETDYCTIAQYNFNYYTKPMLQSSIVNAGLRGTKSQCTSDFSIKGEIHRENEKVSSSVFTIKAVLKQSCS